MQCFGFLLLCYPAGTSCGGYQYRGSSPCRCCPHHTLLRWARYLSNSRHRHGGRADQWSNQVAPTSSLLANMGHTRLLRSPSTLRCPWAVLSLCFSSTGPAGGHTNQIERRGCSRAAKPQPELEPPHFRSVSQHLLMAAWCQPGFALQEATLGSWMGPCTHGGCSWPRGTFLVGCSEVACYRPAQISLLSPVSLATRIKTAQKILLHKTNAFFPLAFSTEPPGLV